MEKLLALTVPGYDAIGAPEGVPTGGITEGSNILQWAVTLLIVVGVIVALFMLIYSGLQWIQSGGDKEKLVAARQRIIYTIIGLVVIFLSFMIINVIGTIFGVQLLGGTSDGKKETRVTAPSRRDCNKNPNQNGCPK